MIIGVLSSVFILLVFYGRSALPFFGSSSAPPQQFHLSRSSLELSIEAVSLQPPTIRATITNNHDSTSIHLCTWGTPLDDYALRLGVFEIVDLSTNKALQLPSIKLDRPFPPPREAFWILEPLHAVTKTIVLSSPGKEDFPAGLKLETGREYEIRAKGHWRAVWHANVADVGEGTLKRTGGGTGLWSGGFVSERVRLKAS